MDYFTSSCEIPAFVIGFRAESSFMEQPEHELIKSYLNRYQELGALSASEADKVMQSWTDHSFA